MKSGWKKYLLYSILIIVGGSLLFVLIRLGYLAEWTGFGEYTSTNPDILRSKTLWDWMELLIIPAVLAGGAFFLNNSVRRNEQKIMDDRQQEAALQNYLDRMSELLLEGNLQTTKRKSVRNVARTRTLTVLRGLDGKRKRIVLLFLWEAGLIYKEKLIIDLDGADFSDADLRGINLVGIDMRGRIDMLRADLQGINLSGADLEGALLGGTNLLRAILRNAKLYGANLVDVDLSGAKLNGANLKAVILRNATLVGANLEGANLYGADLIGVELIASNLKKANLTKAQLNDASLQAAYLKGAYVTLKQLEQAKSLNGTIMPDGTKHE